MKFIKQHQISIFFVLLFVLSWFPWYTGIAPEAVVFMPSILGLVMAFAINGKKGGIALLRSSGRWRVAWRYWAVALAGPPFAFAIGLAIYMLFGGELPSFTVLREELHLLPIWILIVFLPLNGPVGEEIGWRGYLLPQLQKKSGPLVASLIIGVVWGIWHLPDFYNPETVQASLGFVFLIPFVLGTVANSVIMTWLYNKSKGSALIAGIIWHAATDFWAPMFLADFSIAAGPGGAVSVSRLLYGLVLVVLMIMAGIVTFMTKGKLGYRAIEEQAEEQAAGVATSTVTAS